MWDEQRCHLLGKERLRFTSSFNYIVTAVSNVICKVAENGQFRSYGGGSLGEVGQ
jgi:hypothetical protein